MTRPRTSAIGSSPLARGLLGVDTHTPMPIADHPRSRGVYKPFPERKTKCSGSSPLARGLPKTRIDNEGVLGIIPARAGFTD